MCFVIDKKYPNAMVADEDVVCFKLFRKKNKIKPINPTRLALYNFFSSPKIKRLFIKEFEIQIYEAIVQNTLYQITGMPEKHVTIVPWEKFMINEGYHSYTSYLAAVTAPWFGTHTVIKCVIPKGTIYYRTDENHQFVSETILLVEEVAHG